MKWQPSLGARSSHEGTRFCVWAPEAKRVEVVPEKGRPVPLTKNADGTFAGLLPDVHAGQRYRYRVDDKGTFPDPVSRFQPDGVHGPSEVVDAGGFSWSDAGWRGVARNELVIYELHVGTFTPAGTFQGVIEHLPHLVDLGVTAIELLPLADFPGKRNWGYDGVSLFAPPRCYGRPDDLRRLVDAAHRLGLAVLLDVVYNHLGPDGNYLSVYSPYYFSKTHSNAWGASLNFDGKHSNQVRRFFIENALYWLNEYHFDGLRLDATHALLDDGPRHFLAELSAAAVASVPDRHVVLIAEDHRNLARMLQPETAGGWGLDGVWADDFHHQVRRRLAGDHESYYADFTGSLPDLATTIRQGWFYCGQRSLNMKEARGTDPSAIALEQCVICLQNHDQIGNRAFGDRLHHQIDPAAYRAASALLLCCPETPMLFMGQEWAASTPFLFFTDHKPELGRLVTQGRRREFKQFSAFTDPAVREKIPDPQAESTFLSSRLNWAESGQEPHASCLRLYQALLRLRRSEPALRPGPRESVSATPAGETALLLQRRSSSGPDILVVVQFGSSGSVSLPSAGDRRRWEVVLTTEDAPFSPKPNPPRIEMKSILFHGPAAVILRQT
jgi:maltooligosyltrehalose trehalohydrolase